MKKLAHLTRTALVRMQNILEEMKETEVGIGQKENCKHQCEMFKLEQGKDWNNCRGDKDQDIPN